MIWLCKETEYNRNAKKGIRIGRREGEVAVMVVVVVMMMMMMMHVISRLIYISLRV
jgi:hypothetical protein